MQLLQKLQISNYALISELTLEFNKGLTVVTGETGSGKSILLGALGLTLGERSSSSSVRHGADLCIVEAIFDTPLSRNILCDFGFEVADIRDNKILIRREVSSNGRSRAFINDSLVSVGILKEVGIRLVDLHGQDETRSLLDRDKRLDLLDDFGKHYKVRDKYRIAFSAWRTAVEKLKKLEMESNKPQADRSYLQFQIEELNLLNLGAFNQEELENEYNELTHATELAKGLNLTFELLDNGGSESDAVSSIKSAIKELEEIERFNKSAGSLLERLKSVNIEIRDIAAEASILAEGITHDPERLAITEEKMEALSRALHKHNSLDAQSLLLIEKELMLQLDKCDGLDRELQEARESVGRTFDTMKDFGTMLTEARAKSGTELLKIVHVALSPLKLPKVKMSWEFKTLATPDLHGIEDVELLFSANPGSPQQPMSQVASGGERSRVMLAFKAALATKTQVPTIVLDEIDTGVSGDVATRMAETMLSMSKKQQVFSVTHLAQVAARGDFHLEVRKNTTDSEANTIAKYLNGLDRTESIATMISGSSVSDEARAAAKVLLNTH
ncbi:MAG: DNA repair protein RecN [Bacteroidetes bacterium]|nr:MAG: DNA repair protein RecN [Bacteroidota bacterium]